MATTSVSQAVNQSVKQSVSWPRDGLNVDTFIFAGTCCKLQLRQIFIHIRRSKHNFLFIYREQLEAGPSLVAGGRWQAATPLPQRHFSNCSAAMCSLLPKNQLTTTRNLWHLCKKQANKCSHFCVAYKAAFDHGLPGCNTLVNMEKGVCIDRVKGVGYILNTWNTIHSSSIFEIEIGVEKVFVGVQL